MVFARQELKALPRDFFWGLAMGSLFDDSLRRTLQIIKN
jgi:hypothetical protein